MSDDPQFADDVLILYEQVHQAKFEAQSHKIELHSEVGRRDKRGVVILQDLLDRICLRKYAVTIQQNLMMDCNFAPKDVYQGNSILGIGGIGIGGIGIADSPDCELFAALLVLDRRTAFEAHATQDIRDVVNLNITFETDDAMVGTTY